MFFNGKCDDGIPAFSCSKHRDSYLRWLQQHPEQRRVEVARHDPLVDTKKKEKEYVPIKAPKIRARETFKQQQKYARFSGGYQRTGGWSQSRILRESAQFLRTHCSFCRGDLQRYHRSLLAAIMLPNSVLRKCVLSLRRFTPLSRFNWVRKKIGLKPEVLVVRGSRRRTLKSNNPGGLR